MVEVEAKIINTRGLHARPAAKLAKMANSYACSITVGRGKRFTDGKSIASLLTLAATCNSTLTIRADGVDENKAVDALLKLIAAGFRDDTLANNPEEAEMVLSADNQVGEKSAASYMISGIGVTNSVVVGRVQIHTTGDAEVPHYRLEKRQIAAEVRRYEKALETVRGDFEQLRVVAAQLPSSAEIMPFIDLYKTFLDDPEFSEKPQSLIRRRLINAEWAMKERVDIISDNFRRIPDDYLRERGRDIGYVMERLLTAMRTGRRRRNIKTVPADKKVILLAADLDPADIIRVQRLGYLGFVTESGSATSHTAILARSMNIPALIGARGALARARHGARVLLDAGAENIVFNPSAGLLRRYKSQPPKKSPPRRRRRALPNGVLTLDREQVFLYTNIELPDEANITDSICADGIGLFRTEFLFMQRSELPSEDEQFEIYRDVLARVAPLPVTIRTLDLGADKMLSLGGAKAGVNPALGLRAIRYCLAHPDLFLTQLRALLRAGACHNNLRILFPMLSHPSELERTMAMIGNAHEQLRISDGLDVPLPPLGGMIEVPSSVFIMQAMAQHLDFFSIGTNDLIQYTLAIDRNEELLTLLYDPLHPAVLQLLTMIVANAKRANKPVVLCGEMAGEVSMTRLMLGLGLRQLSMNGNKMEAVRERVRETNFSGLRRAMQHLLRAPDPKTAQKVVDEMNALS